MKPAPKTSTLYHLFIIYYISRQFIHSLLLKAKLTKASGPVRCTRARASGYRRYLHDIEETEKMKTVGRILLHGMHVKRLSR